MCARLCYASGDEHTESLPVNFSIHTTERYLDCKQRIKSSVNDQVGSMREHAWHSVPHWE